MSKTTAPLLSFGASGQVAKTQVYSTWRGIPYVRRYVTPANPQTSGQTETRSVFAFASNIWKNAGALLQAPWTAFSQGQPFYNRNAFIGRNTKALRPGTDLTDFVGSPGAKGGLAASSITVTGGVGELEVAFVLPDPPTGWAVSSTVAVAIKAQDPHTPTSFTSYEASASTTPYTVTISDVPAGSYEVSAWVVWTKPDGSLAYGPSINGTGTAT